MQKFEIIDQGGMRVLTSTQLACAYGTTRQIISNNYSRNSERYKVGKHYIVLENKELACFKASHQIDDNLKYSSKLYLWTEKGALLHAKSLNTDKAWEVYDYLVDFYFRVKETSEAKEYILPAPKQQERKLVENDERTLAYNRGIVLGVLRSELEEDSALEIYERLSVRGKSTVMKLLFGEVCHAK